MQAERDFPLSPWMTMTEVCEHLRITRQTVNRYVREGRLNKYKIGDNLIRFNREEVTALVVLAEPGTGPAVMPATAE